jgi:hypothetical protein
MKIISATEKHRILLGSISVLALALLLVSTSAVAVSGDFPTPTYGTNCGWQLQSEGYFWTPVILLNSPYGGTASASSSVSYTGEISISGITTSTSTISSQSISASGGQSQGEFELDLWVEYTSSVCTPSPDVFIYQRTQIYTTQNLGTYSTVTSYPSSFYATYNGVSYPSITFGGQWSTDNDGAQGTCGGGGPSLFTSTTTTTSISASVDFSNSYVASGLLDVSVSSSNGNTQSFTYNFPGNYGWWYIDSLNGNTGSSAGALAFDYYTGCSSGGGGGGGCVLSGTLITLASGTQIPVQDLQIGQKVLSYNTHTGKIVTTTVYNNTAIHVSQVLDINNGLLYASGLNDQPIYAQFQNGTQKWVELGQLTVGMKIFDPVTNSWTPVTSIQTISGSFTVYDLRTANAQINNYVANGVLMDMKI